MWARRVAPASIVVRESVVWRAEVCGGDEDGGAASVAPPRVTPTLYLKTRAAAEPIVEQGCAQRRRVDTVSLTVQISVPTCSAYNGTQRNT